MRKLLNLYRLNFGNAVKMPRHWFKHAFGLKFSPEESTLNEYYVQLIVNDGFLKSENETSYSSFFPKWNAYIKTRKQPAEDLAVFGKVFAAEEYKSLVDVYTNYFTPNKPVIIDAGSHIGLLAIYLSRVFVDPRIICVEKEAQHQDTLAFNLTENVACSERLEGDLQTHPIPEIMHLFGLKKIDILKMRVNHLENDTFAASNLSFLEVTRCVAFTASSESGREIICEALDKHGFTHFNAGKLTICINKNLI